MRYSRILIGVILAALPGWAKIPIYRLFFRYEIGKGVRIGLSPLIGVSRCRIGDGARIGPGNLFVEVGDLTIDRLARVVAVRGETVRLAGKEFELLSALADEPHRVFTKDELLRDVWGYRSFTRTLDSHVSRLRQKLERAPDDRFVVNVWGVGYKLVD